MDASRAKSTGDTKGGPDRSAVNAWARHNSALGPLISMQKAAGNRSTTLFIQRLRYRGKDKIEDKPPEEIYESLLKGKRVKEADKDQVILALRQIDANLARTDEKDLPDWTGLQKLLKVQMDTRQEIVKVLGQDDARQLMQGAMRSMATGRAGATGDSAPTTKPAAK